MRLRVGGLAGCREEISAGLRGQNGRNQAGRGARVKCRSACGHFVQYFSKGEDVGARVCLASFQLLWRHVLECTENGASVVSFLSEVISVKASAIGVGWDLS